MLGQPSKKTIAKYMDMCCKPGYTWSEIDITSFRSLLNNKLRDMPDTKAALLECFNASLGVAPFQLERSQQAKGVEWLLRTQVNSKGSLRNANTTFIGEIELNILRKFDTLELVGLNDISTIQQRSVGWFQYVACYRLNSVAGTSFTYGPYYGGQFKVFNTGTSRPELKIV